MEKNVFTDISDAIISSMTHFINAYSGLLQIFVYLAIGILFLLRPGQVLVRPALPGPLRFRQLGKDLGIP